MLTASQIAAAMDVSVGRVYRALSKPFPLPFVVSQASANGGGRERLYSISNVLPRVKDTFNPSPARIRKLFELGGYNV